MKSVLFLLSSANLLAGLFTNNQAGYFFAIWLVLLLILDEVKK